MAEREVLRAEGLEAGYGSVQVLWGAGLRILDGETVVLLGANGAGKTTLLKTLMGLVRAWKGRIVFLGEDVEMLRTDRRVRAGMAYMSEMGCFAGLTVEENIKIGGKILLDELPGDDLALGPGMSVVPKVRVK